MAMTRSSCARSKLRSLGRSLLNCSLGRIHFGPGDVPLIWKSEEDAGPSAPSLSQGVSIASYKPVWSLDGARFLPFEISPPTTWLIPAVLRAALLQLWSPDSRHLVLIVIRIRRDEMLWPAGGRFNYGGHVPRHKQHRAALGGGVVTESRVVLGRERRHRRTWNVILPIRRPI